MPPITVLDAVSFAEDGPEPLLQGIGLVVAQRVMNALEHVAAVARLQIIYAGLDLVSTWDRLRSRMPDDRGAGHQRLSLRRDEGGGEQFVGGLRNLEQAEEFRSEDFVVQKL